MRLYELIEQLSKYDKTLILTATKNCKTKEIKEVSLRVSATSNYPKGRYLDIKLEK